MPTIQTIIETEYLPNPSPGETLAEEFLRPLALSQSALATGAESVATPDQ
jgi:plasmid maintenance system antidote protein VapI